MARLENKSAPHASLFSMTGFGESEISLKDRKIYCRIKSLNHRFLEMKIRLPRQEPFNENYQLEMQIRKKTSEILKRGSVEITISLDDKQKDALGVDTATALRAASELEDLCKKISAHVKKKNRSPAFQPRYSLDTVLRLPSIEQKGSSEKSPPEFIQKLLLPALENLQRGRKQEGEKICEHLLQLVSQLRKHLDAVTQLERAEKETSTQTLADRLKETMKLLTEATGDTPSAREFMSRLREEAALWVERRDYDEERVRLGIHLEKVEELLRNPEPAVGRKLEFMQQEMHREVSTMGSKTQSTDVGSRVVEMKAVLERFKEQVANVE